MNGDDSLALISYGLNTNWTNDPNQVQVCKFRLTRLIKCRCASAGPADRKQVKLISTGKKQGEGPTQGNTNMETKTLDTHTKKKYYLLLFNFRWQRSNLHQYIVLLGVEVTSYSEGRNSQQFIAEEHRHTHANRQSRASSVIIRLEEPELREKLHTEIPQVREKNLRLFILLWCNRVNPCTEV